MHPVGRSHRKATTAKLGVTQTQLGKLLDVSQVAVSEWETGRSAPSNMAGAKRELGVDPGNLLAAAVIEDDVVRAIYSNKELSEETQRLS